MGAGIDKDNFHLQDPRCPGVSKELFQTVNEGEQGAYCLKFADRAEGQHGRGYQLGKYMLPDKRDYGVFVEPEFPEADLSETFRKEAPINNLAMEIACGKVGHRTRKIRKLGVTSRSIMIEGT